MLHNRKLTLDLFDQSASARGTVGGNECSDPSMCMSLWRVLISTAGVLSFELERVLGRQSPGLVLSLRIPAIV